MNSNKNIKVADFISFKFKDRVVKCRVDRFTPYFNTKEDRHRDRTYYYYLQNLNSTGNCGIFNLLKIIDLKEFTTKCYGHSYIGSNCGFPYANSIENLSKLILKINEMIADYDN